MTNTTATPAEAPGQSTALLLLLKLRTFIALIAVVVFFSAMAPNFVSIGNAVIVAKHVAINAFLAIGMTYVILTGGIDLSVGAIVGLVGMVAGALVLYGIPLEMFGVVIYPNVWEVILIALAVGTFVGLVNGLLITRMQVAPFIATLGMLYVARGTALLMSGGSTFPNLVGKPEFGNQGFPVLGAGTLLGIPCRSGCCWSLPSSPPMSRPRRPSAGRSTPSAAMSAPPRSPASTSTVSSSPST